MLRLELLVGDDSPLNGKSYGEHVLASPEFAKTLSSFLTRHSLNGRIKLLAASLQSKLYSTNILDYLLIEA